MPGKARTQPRPTRVGARRFVGYRPNIPGRHVAEGRANLPTAPQYEGVVFTDGTVAVRWLTEHRSVSFWADFREFLTIHGHPDYGTRIVWLDPLEEAAG